MNKLNFGLQTHYGFISIRQVEDVGYCGGLLVVSERGRPLEFHCSAPVTPHPTQQILYGKTYQTYLFCEQIGLALLEKSKLDLSVVVGNSMLLWDLADSIESPVVILDADCSSDQTVLNKDQACRFNISTFQLVWNHDSSNTTDVENQQRQQIRLEHALQTLGSNIDLDEPFERIDRAIEAAQSTSPS